MSTEALLNPSSKTSDSEASVVRVTKEPHLRSSAIADGREARGSRAAKKLSGTNKCAFLTHYAALMNKTCIIKKRRKCTTCCECCSPVFFVSMFCLIYLASKDVDHLEQYAMINYPVLPGGLHKSPPMPQPELTIAALDNHGWKIGLYPREDPVMQNFSNWLNAYMPGFDVEEALGRPLNGNESSLRKLNVPKFEDVVMWFDHESDLDAYVRSSDYTDKPLIVSAMTIANTDREKHQWKIVIRANATTVPTTYLDVAVTTRAYPENRQTNYVEMYSTLQPTQIIQTVKDGCGATDPNQWTCDSIFVEDTTSSDPNLWINNYWLPSFVMLQAWGDKFIVSQEGEHDAEPSSSHICPLFEGEYRYTDCALEPFFGVFTYIPHVFTRAHFSFDNQTIDAMDYFADAKRDAASALANAPTSVRTNFDAHAKRFLGSRGFFPYTVRTTTFPSVAYTQNDFYNDNVMGAIAFFFVLAFSYSIFQLIKSIVWEKESKIKEGMKMMGLVESALLWSWITTYLLIFVVVAVGVTFVCKSTVFGSSDVSVLFVFFFSFCVSAVCFSYLITVFFDKATSAAVIGALVFVGGFFPIYAVNTPGSTRESKIACALLSPVAMGLGMNSIGFFESAKIGVTWSNWGEVDNEQCLKDMVLMMWLDCAIYLVLGYYLERVLPSEFGVNLPWYFFLMPKFWCGDDNDKSSGGGGKSKTDDDDDDDDGSFSAPTEGVAVACASEGGGDRFVPLSSSDIEAIGSGEVVHKREFGWSFKANACEAGGAASKSRDDRPWSEVGATRLAVEVDDAIVTATRVRRCDFLAGSDGSNKFEPLTREEERMLTDGSCVQIRKLRKEFRTADGTTKVAVDSLRCAMFENQIFVLLGHNGAGKTTTLSQLSGLLPPTSGDALVFGRNIVGDLSAVQRMIGVCPQQNVLYEDLTVMEHLRLYAALKCVPKSEVLSQATSLIQDIALTTKTNALIPTLSGGQKRKVCLAISLVGDSKVLFLDEPTSGMDVFAQRSTWNLLKMKRKGRVIILTTHSMQEADILADRIGIMASGRLICCGSPLFLKSQFGVGYNLTCTRPSDFRISDSAEPGADLLPLIRSKLGKEDGDGTIKVMSDIGKEVSFQVPLGASDRFPDLFADFDALIDRESASASKNVDDSGVRLESYNVSVTTIEEVFIKSAESANRKRAKRRRSSVGALNVVDAKHAADESSVLVVDDDECVPRESEEARIERLYKQSSCLAHFKALLIKRFHNARRDVKGLIFQNVIPFIALLGGLLIIKYVVHYDYPSLEPSLDAFNSHVSGPLEHNTPTVWNNDVATRVLKSDMERAPLRNRRPVFLEETESLIEKWPDYSSDPGNMCLGIGDPDHFASTVNVAFDAYASIAMASESAVAKSVLEDESEQSSILCAANAELLSYIDPKNQFEASAYLAFFANNGRDTARGTDVASYTAMANMSALHATPLLVSLIDSAYLRNTTGDASASIRVVNHPLVMTQHQRAFLGAVSASSVVFFMGLAIAFIPAALCEYIVYETFHEVKHQQLVSGVSLTAYWASTYVWDLIQYVVTGLSCILLIAAFDVSQYTDTDESQLHCTILLFALYGPAAIAFAYNEAYLFVKPYYAVNCLLVFNLVCLIASLAVTILAFFPSTCEAADILRHIFLLIPNYAFVDGFYRLSLLTGLPFVASVCDDSVVATEKWSALDMRAVGLNLVYLAVEIVVYPILAWAIDVVYSYPALQKRLCALAEPTVEDAPFRDDEDVVAAAKAAKAAAASSSSSSSKVVQIRGLRKVYRTKTKSGATKNKAAVKNTWFSVERGECFGLLGVNGAGKSTTFKMLSGDVLPSEGTAILGGRDVLDDQIAVRRLIGYCPQTNALLPRLTCREHLALFARIKGIRDDDLNRIVTEKILELDLVEFENKRAGSLSGGNKRKLCVAIALIGMPPIVFLDEPSAGMDPVAKRFMWEVIARVSTKHRSSTILLTTHSMEECSALCSRMCIMVDGRLRCIGSEQHIKNRFGDGFQLHLRFEDPDDEVEDIAEAIKSNLSSLSSNAAPAPAASASSRERRQSEESMASSLLSRTTTTATDTVSNLLFASSVVVPDDGITENQIPDVCRALGNAARADKFDDATSSAWLLRESLRTDGFVDVDRFARWWILEDRVDHAVRWAKENFGDASCLVEQHGGVNAGLRLPASQSTKRLSRVFKLLADAKSKLRVVEYSLGQTSLEQIFIGFAKSQEGEGEFVRGLRREEDADEGAASASTKIAEGVSSVPL